MTDSIADSLQDWKDGSVIDVVAEMSRLTVEISVRTMFSTSLPDPAVRRAARAVGVVAEGLFRRTILPPFLNQLPTPANLHFSRAQRQIRKLASEMVARRRASTGSHGDLLSALLAAQGEACPGATVRFSDGEVIDQIFTFFLAGVETTASTLTWALYSLVHDRDAIDAVHREVDRVLDGPTACLEDLTKLPAVSRVLTETLRLYSPGWLLTRECSAATELDGVSIPAGTTVLVSPHTLHRRRDLFDDADVFKPDRWIGALPTRHAYIAFGGGARRCIGEQFALTAASLALASISHSWDLAPTVNSDRSITVRDLPAPRRLPMRIDRRHRERGRTSAELADPVERTRP